MKIHTITSYFIYPGDVSYTDLLSLTASHPGLTTNIYPLSTETMVLVASQLTR